MFLPVLIAQLNAPSPQTMNVTVKEVTSPNTFTVKEGFSVRIDCIRPIGDSRSGTISLMNLIMPNDPVTLEYNTSAIVSRVFAQGHSGALINIGHVQVIEGHAMYDPNYCAK